MFFLVSCAAVQNTVKIVKTGNAEKYGESAPKIWTPLTQVEMETLVKAKNALDNETQLVLALFFTGTTREKSEVDSSLAVYRNFIAICDKELGVISDTKEKGRKLHELFFKQFIGSFRKQDSVSSGIAGLLLKREYDTNTASLLFALVAEKYGFSADISVTEDDVSEIRSAKTGLSIEIYSGKSYLTLKHKEMFSAIQVLPFLKNGYDPYINMEFFENLHKSNPAEFAEPEVEFKKYYKRKILSFKEDIFLQYKIDKGNESFDAELSPFQRRVEMAATLSDSCEVLIDRIRAWRNIHTFILQRKKTGELLSFIDTINTELDRTGKICKDEPGFTETSWDLFLFSAFEYANAVQGAGMEITIRNAYNFLSTTSENYDKKKILLAGAINLYMNQVIKTGLIEKELEYVTGIIDAIPDNRTRMEVSSSFHYKAGEYYFNTKDHWRSGQFYADCAFIENNPYKKICIQKGVEELYKYAEKSLENKICATASDARDKCLEKIHDKEACAKITQLVNNTCK